MIWATMAVSGLVTFLLRFSVIYQVKSSNLPGWLENPLNFASNALSQKIVIPISFGDIKLYICEKEKSVY